MFLCFPCFFSWPFSSLVSFKRKYMKFLQERLLEIGYKRSCNESTTSRFWPAFVLGDALQIVFQNLLLESNDDIIQSSKRVWRLLLQVTCLLEYQLAFLRFILLVNSRVRDSLF